MKKPISAEAVGFSVSSAEVLTATKIHAIAAVTSASLRTRVLIGVLFFEFEGRQGIISLTAVAIRVLRFSSARLWAATSAFTPAPLIVSSIRVFSAKIFFFWLSKPAEIPIHNLLDFITVF
jgi:hypothetical protein